MQVLLLFTSVALVQAVHDFSPLHLQPLSPAHIARRQAPQLAPVLTAIPPEKQDNIFFSPLFSSPPFQALVQSAAVQNQQCSAQAIQQGKNQPKVTIRLGGQDVGLGKREDVASGTPWDWSKQKIRGVNLGGFLVLEAWITPTLFAATNNPAIIDEWTFGQYLEPPDALARLQAHWATWITESDIQQIASYGLNHVRIPIGYWAFDVAPGEPYVQGQYPYLLKTIQWCQAHGVRVIVDIHGAPGSQNGFDNSGRAGNILWDADTANVNRTLAIVQTLAREFSQPKYQGIVTALQILNEPAGYHSQQLLKTYKQFAYDSYQVLRRVLRVHADTVFSNSDIAMKQDDRIQSICKMSSYLARSNNNLWTIVGEWSPAPTDCAAALNATAGRGSGSRYDGTFPGSTAVGTCSGMTGNGSNFSADYKVYLRKFFEVQTTTYENFTSGYLMWAWKTENAADWSWSAGVAGGWIPRDPTEKLYGNQCQ